MKTKRNTKPMTLKAKKLSARDLRMATELGKGAARLRAGVTVDGLELRLDNFQTSTNGRFDRLEDAFNSVWNQHRERIEKLERRADNAELAIDVMRSCKRIEAMEKLAATASVNKPESYGISIGPPMPPGSFVGVVPPEEPSPPEPVIPEGYEWLREHWETCDEAEAWPMGESIDGYPLFALCVGGYKHPRLHRKPFLAGAIPIKPRMKR